MINKAILIALTAFLPLAALAQQTYQLDLKKSSLFWKSPKSMGKQHYGYLSFKSGSLSYSATGEPATGEFNIDMNSINSIDRQTEAQRKEVNELLKNKDFFAVAKYPNTIMAVKKIVKTQQRNVYSVSGDLTIRGITRPIVFTATITKNGGTVAAKAEFMVDRIKWNIHHQPDEWNFFVAVKNKVIADEFPVKLDLVFR